MQERKFAVTENTPGYLPENDPAYFDTFDEASDAGSSGLRILGRPIPRPASRDSAPNRMRFPTHSRSLTTQGLAATNAAS